MILLLAFRLFILFNSKIIVKGLHSAYVEPLACIVWNSFQVDWEKNSTYQLQFTSYADGSIGYDLLDVESSIFFDGQEYIIKQCMTDFSKGLETKNISAIHIFNEIKRVKQRKVKTGTHVYLPEDVLAFYLTDNSFGFSWKVIGEFEKQQITDLGNSDGKDMFSKITSTWDNAVIYPDNKKIVVYSYEKFVKDLGNRLDYLHNSDDIQLTYDSTEMVNQIKVFGKKKENDSYYFEPFIVTDTESVKKWGLHVGDDLSDERFTVKTDMEKFAKSKLVPEPSLTISLSVKENVKPIPGERKRLEVMGFVTWVDVVSYKWMPFSSDQSVTITLNNTAKTILDYQKKNKKDLTNMVKKISTNANHALDKATNAYNARIYGSVVKEVNEN